MPDWRFWFLVGDVRDRRVQRLGHLGAAMNLDRLERVFFGAVSMFYALLAVAFVAACILGIAVLAAAVLT